MVYIERDKQLSKVKRYHCRKIIDEDEKKAKDYISQRKRYIAKELIRDARGTIKQEAEKLLKVNDRLKVKRRESETKCTSLVDQWNRLKTNEEEFHCIFIQFHQFTIGNREKIERERAKILQLRQSRAAKEVAIRELSGKILYFEDIFVQMKQEFEKHFLYEKFLSQYAMCTKAKSVQDVLFRYALLVESRECMDETMKRRHSYIRQYTKNYNTILQSWKGELLKFGETLTKQSKKFEEAKQQVIYWEKTIYNIKRHAHSLWVDIEMTREALDHIVCLLLIRMKARVKPGFFSKDRKFNYLLTTTEGKILYMNKILGDLMRVKNEVLEIFEEEKRTAKINVATEMKPRPKGRATFKRSKKPVVDKFPTLSPATSRIIDILENNMKRAAGRTRARLTKSGITPNQSYATTTTLDSGDSWEPRARAMTSWWITKEAKTKEKLPPIITETTSAARDTLFSSASSRYSVPWLKRSEIVPSRYSCVTLTTDPSTFLLDEKRTEVRDRIIERNFDRYEKYVFNKLDTDSSLMKVNKKTGKLELPKLKLKRKHPVEKLSVAVTLPKIEVNSQRKLRKRGLEDASNKTYGSQNVSLKSNLKTKKEILLFEDIKNFLRRPTITEQFTFGNLL